MHSISREILYPKNIFGIFVVLSTIFSCVLILEFGFAAFYFLFFSWFLIFVLSLVCAYGLYFKITNKRPSRPFKLTYILFFMCIFEMIFFIFSVSRIVHFTIFRKSPGMFVHEKSEIAPAKGQMCTPLVFYKDSKGCVISDFERNTA